MAARGAKAAALALTGRIAALPVVHGSGDFAVEVRDRLLRMEPDCIAVPLPPSFEEEVLAGVEELPRIAAVAQEEENPGIWAGAGEGAEEEPEGFQEDADDWPAPDPGAGGEEAPGAPPAWNYVPIDPCQPVVAALRLALEERVPVRFVDMEVARFETEAFVLPDPYALKKVSLEAFAAALMTAAPRPAPGSQREARIRWMARELRRLEGDFRKIAFVGSAMDWPFLRAALRAAAPAPGEEAAAAAPRRFGVHPDTLAFLLGEVPYITYLYERRREELRADRHMAVDGVKELILEARAAWLAEHRPAHNWVTPQRLQIFLQYVRNLTLQSRRLTPDLFTLVAAAKQCAGDAFALCLAETARRYPYQEDPEEDLLRVGVGRAELPDGGVGLFKNRLGGQAVRWRRISLKPRPTPFERERWAQRWNPYGMCSWPPEDDRIESFHTHVREQAKALIGEDLARTEKFTTSIKDGLDMRETLRNWHTGDLYVKEIPPARGEVEVVVFLFDTPADPQKYPWRTMWYAEHEGESTLCMYATPFEGSLVGPGIAESLYGGAFFLFPPRFVEDVWRDPRFDFAETLEERLIAGACFHSRERSVALVSPRPPRARWRRIARLLKRHLIYLPLARFSGETIARIRRFHVLNGKEVRSYAARFIREM